MDAPAINRLLGRFIGGNTLFFYRRVRTHWCVRTGPYATRTEMAADKTSFKKKASYRTTEEELVNAGENVDGGPCNTKIGGPPPVTLHTTTAHLVYYIQRGECRGERRGS